MTHSQNSKNWTFFQYDSKNCLFFFNVTRRIEPLFECLNELNPFVDWLKELNPVFFFFCQYDSKDWTFEVWFKELNLFFLNTTHRIKDWFFQFDSKNWMWLKALNPRFSTWLKKNWTFFSVWLEDLNFLLEICLIELNLLKKKKWLEELIFRKISIKIKKHFLMIQRINWALFSEWLKDFVEYDLKESNFFLWIWLQESTFLKICSKNCFKVWFAELNLFFSITYRMEHLRVWLKRIDLSLQ